MANPIFRGGQIGVPHIEFYLNWLNGTKHVFPDNPAMDAMANATFKTDLVVALRDENPLDIANNLFLKLRRCTAQQLSVFENCLQDANCSLDVMHVDEAVTSMGKYGALAKIKSLYPRMTWTDFVQQLGLFTCLSSQHVLAYASDVLDWYEQEHYANSQSCYQTMMLTAIQQCGLPAHDVVDVMKRIRGERIAEGLDFVQATENAMSIIYDTSGKEQPTKDDADKLADQCIMLHEGWGIAYPVALLTLLGNGAAHNKSFDIPSAETLVYPTGQEDADVARVFKNKGHGVDSRVSETMEKAQLVQTLYDEQSTFQFCVEGADAFFAKNKAAELTVHSTIFHDVGQP